MIGLIIIGVMCVFLALVWWMLNKTIPPECERCHVMSVKEKLNQEPYCDVPVIIWRCPNCHLEVEK